MHSDDPADVPPENEKQPEPDQQSSIASQNASAASNEPKRARQGPTSTESTPPSSARVSRSPQSLRRQTDLQRRRDEYVDREMRREEMKRYEIRPQLDRLHAQLSDAIKDTEYWLTLELTTEEQKYVEQMLVVLSPWHRGVNEVLSGLPLSDAHSHWLEFAEMFLHLYRKASEVRGWAVGEHLGHLADWVSFELAEMNKTHEAQLAAVETSVAAHKAGPQPRARNQKQAVVSTSVASQKKKPKRKPKPKRPKLTRRRRRVNEFLRHELRGESNRKQLYSVAGVDPSDARRWQRGEHVSKRVSDSMEATLKMKRDDFDDKKR